MATAILLKPTTPPDYHRIVSPNLVIPSEKTVPIPVGLLACQRKSSQLHKVIHKLNRLVQAIHFKGLWTPLL